MQRGIVAVHIAAPNDRQFSKFPASSSSSALLQISPASEKLSD